MTRAVATALLALGCSAPLEDATCVTWIERPYGWCQIQEWCADTSQLYTIHCDADRCVCEHDPDYIPVTAPARCDTSAEVERSLVACGFPHRGSR